MPRSSDPGRDGEGGDMGKRGRAEKAIAALFLLGLFASPGWGQSEFATLGLPDCEPPPPPRDVPVWGLAGVRGYVLGEQVAPNGLEFTPLFNLELDFNFWLWRSQRVYAFTDTLFWTQRAAAGVTNAGQGVFDFSKREFDLSGGAAWNYHGPWEVRVFAYSFNNLNRGDSAWQPNGFADGVGLENRYYLSDVYSVLGTDAFDQARATFLSAGFYPTKDMVDGQGVRFKPGPFARADLTLNILGDWCYLYGDGEFIATRSFTPKLLQLDAGVAARPWACAPRLEFRLGTDDTYDLRNTEWERSLYGAVRIVY
jgi:hypothetical protein